MSVEVSPQVMVRRGRAEVAAYMFDPAHDLEWTGGITASRPAQPGPLRTGAQVERSAGAIHMPMASGQEHVIGPLGCYSASDDTLWGVSRRKKGAAKPWPGWPAISIVAPTSRGTEKRLTAAVRSMASTITRRPAALHSARTAWRSMARDRSGSRQPMPRRHANFSSERRV